ncbi:hypothetical protein HETIRDRAFT_430570 [Heterobasidion irregulare TC 32-1]|uniref:Uncharacterized protein n=1 Tax=Heterobasidion irregulare (strain TC 32-1) TaxID=747525 RepID=W4JTL1_HETIT|nr:uncharacterized protein HETIRDRAFT_430570 [Heterobasidion irregulare TC 32-1]ETW76231.1 hypothetical protein HETIRDRAFT_430570 [Heterobasidion irregulare TC 32-1]
MSWSVINLPSAVAAQRERLAETLKYNILLPRECIHPQIARKIGYLIVYTGHALGTEFSLSVSVPYPFSHEEQAEFAKCDSICGGSEHATTGSQSFCTKEIFHAPLSLDTAPDSALGSWSMTQPDCRPLSNTPSYQLISQKANNRYGAVLSALYGFWSARQAVVQSANGARRDVYSVVTFSTSSRLGEIVSSGTLVTEIVRRAPVLVFLSDGEAQVSDATVYDICRKAVTLG